ncbi:hypothetical protein [uncultured Nostoc sp.]|uniref:hypothetical protein n=1 Tax=uncultured Nostoc sp. TaxID=340711 RepID=UPI0035C9F4BF
MRYAIANTTRVATTDSAALASQTLRTVANAVLPLRREPPNGKATCLQRWTHRNALAPLRNRIIYFLVFS